MRERLDDYRRVGSPGDFLQTKGEQSAWSCLAGHYSPTELTVLRWGQLVEGDSWGGADLEVLDDVIPYDLSETVTRALLEVRDWR